MLSKVLKFPHKFHLKSMKDRQLFVSIMIKVGLFLAVWS